MMPEKASDGVALGVVLLAGGLLVVALLNGVATGLMLVDILALGFVLMIAAGIGLKGM